MSRESNGGGGGIFASLPLISVLDRRTMNKARRLLEEANDLREQIKTLKERYEEIVGSKTITGELERIQQESGQEGLRWGDWAYRSYESEGRKTLDKGLLIENGCDPEVIAQSYKTGKAFMTRKFVNLAKGEEDE